MSDAKAWLYLDGPEPEHLRPLLDTLRDAPPVPPEVKEATARQLFAKLTARRAQRV